MSERPPHGEPQTLADSVRTELAEIVADLREVMDWELTGGTSGWMPTPRAERALPPLEVGQPDQATPGAARAVSSGPAAARPAPPSMVPPSMAPPARPTAAAPPAAAAASAPAGPRPEPPAPQLHEAVGDLSGVADLEALRTTLGNCGRCKLSKERTNIVFGQGAADADLLLVGEGPGYHEDRTGQAFVGAAGDLLTRILKAIGLERDEVYICNIVKCRPPKNRDPEVDEVAACAPFVARQMQLVKPKVILALGRVAGQTLLGRQASLRSMRGQFYDYNGTPLLVTYHPAAVLRDAKLKRPVWEDVKAVKAKLE